MGIAMKRLGRRLVPALVVLALGALPIHASLPREDDVPSVPLNIP